MGAPPSGPATNALSKRASSTLSAALHRPGRRVASAARHGALERSPGDAQPNPQEAPNQHPARAVLSEFHEHASTWPGATAAGAVEPRTRQCGERIEGSAEERADKSALVLAHGASQPCGQGEDDVEVRDGQKQVALSVEPAGGGTVAGREASTARLAAIAHRPARSARVGPGRLSEWRSPSPRSS